MTADPVGRLAVTEGSAKRLRSETSPGKKTSCSTPGGIHTACEGGTTENYRLLTPA